MVCRLFHCAFRVGGRARQANFKGPADKSTVCAVVVRIVFLWAEFLSTTLLPGVSLGGVLVRGAGNSTSRDEISYSRDDVAAGRQQH